MNVGEKIQSYRKSFGLSQEELGQKLCVSRQTVSLWEKGQTVPTIDNLILLKEIFGVSVDELLDVKDGNSFAEEVPTEHYKFSFSQDEIDAVYKLQRPAFYGKMIAFVLFFIILILFLISSSDPDSAPDLLIGFNFGMLFLGFIYQFKGIRALKKTWNISKKRICGSVYEYRIYHDFLIIDIYRQGEKVRESKCHFSEIEKVQPLGNYLLFQYGGQAFIVKKADLTENSFFYAYMYNNPDKIIQQTTPYKWKIPSNILFVASFLSIFGALSLIGTVSAQNNLFTENLWLYFLFTPIPIASTVFGFVLKSKGYKYKKNVIAGIIMTALLCIYGSFTFIRVFIS